MIYSLRHRFVFVSCPRCSSHSIYRVLRSKRYGGRVVPGFHPRAIRREHRDWFKFAAVRNPYDRTMSQWWVICHSDPREWHRSRKQNGTLRDIRKAIGKASLERYLEYLLEHREQIMRSGAPDREWVVGQAQWYWPLVGQLHRMIRIEDLEADFESLPFVARRETFGRLNRHGSERRAPRAELLTPRVIELVHEWAGEDFDFYDYEKEAA